MKIHKKCKDAEMLKSKNAKEKSAKRTNKIKAKTIKQNNV